MMKFETKAIHIGQEPEQVTGSITVPIFQTSTYANESLGLTKGYDYGRTINPTRIALEKNLASLENGTFSTCFSSGMAAIHSILSIFKPGDHIICSRNLYGGSYRLFENIFTTYGLIFDYVNTSIAEEIEKSFRVNTKLVYIETPTNPLLEISDIEAIAKICSNYKAYLCVDNTFLSPYFQTPLDFGADIVIHSTTKYINGHCDIIGGVVVTNKKEIDEKLKFFQNSIGAVPSPFDCWLTLRSVKTLALRMIAHNNNALHIYEFLRDNKKIKKIYYPGDPEHPLKAVIEKQMRGYGGIISIDLGSASSAQVFCNNLQVFSIAESLGGVESLACHPATMTHTSIPEDVRNKIGITNGLVRLSVGIEHYEDLIADIDYALSKI
ncbi:MAG: trans-sulfuration enzyme family protein [Ignavibacteria bacterium]